MKTHIYRDHNERLYNDLSEDESIPMETEHAEGDDEAEEEENRMETNRKMNAFYLLRMKEANLLTQKMCG